MGHQTVVGLYDDYNSEWILQYNENAGIKLYYNSSIKLATTSIGITITGTATASDFILTSDKRLKTNIDTLTKGIDGLKPVSFIYKNDKDSATTYGFIAQDMLESHPELVMGTGEEKVNEKGETEIDYYSIKQNSIIALLVKEVQELKEEKKTLNTKITSLEDRLVRIEKLLL